jgi:MurNAc alpha-1-phosphate uridylyltransferase
MHVNGSARSRSAIPHHWPRRAFVYASGYGTRLRPLTLTTPKPMLQLFGRPIVEHVLAGLAAAGIRQVTVNAAWLADAFAGLPAAGRRLGLDVTLSIQEKPLEHGGDLAFADTFLRSLEADEVFLAINGDTIVELDRAGLEEAAATVTAAAPVLVLGDRSEAGPLRARPDGTLVGIGQVAYAADEGPSERWDDAGLKLMHSSIRDELPPAGATMSFHGENGLLGRLTAAGRTIRVASAPLRARFEIGTVDEYTALSGDSSLRALTDRLRDRAATSVR